MMKLGRGSGKSSFGPRRRGRRKRRRRRNSVKRVEIQFF
jgi:hypothetical protein